MLAIVLHLIMANQNPLLGTFDDTDKAKGIGALSSYNYGAPAFRDFESRVMNYAVMPMLAAPLSRVSGDVSAQVAYEVNDMTAYDGMRF